MTESMSYLHEFENQRFERTDTIGIEIELPPTLDVVKQKRTAITTRSMKNRPRSNKPPPQAGETGQSNRNEVASLHANHLDESKIFCL